MLDDATLGALRATSLKVRKHILTMVHRAQSGHVGGSLGSTDLLVTLYHAIMRHDPKRPEWPERDRFVMSKGHCTPVIYAILADCGYFPESDLATFRRPDSHLQGHPYAPKTPGIEASTGTLGLGISTAAGMALAGKLRGGSEHYFVLCGDGEIQEGQVWEAAMFANKYKLSNLTGFVDRNYLQTDGNSEDVMPLDPLAPKWEAFGWRTFTVDGHDHNQIAQTIAQARENKAGPSMIIVNTVKGKGVSFMENVVKWHGTPPDDATYEKAMAELHAAGVAS